jgi:hypothetical protein
MAAPRINCHRCAHYFVTWDPRFPHGCRGMGFKSRMIPIEEVRRAMPGHECLLFHAKAQHHAHGSCRASSGASERPPVR